MRISGWMSDGALPILERASAAPKDQHDRHRPQQVHDPAPLHLDDGEIGASARRILAGAGFLRRGELLSDPAAPDAGADVPRQSEEGGALCHYLYPRLGRGRLPWLWDRLFPL